jgi:dephospho-CoA kinase
MIIGIAGKSGSGKSTYAKFLSSIMTNAVHIDIDKIGHEALEEPVIKSTLLNIFGNKILDSEGKIIRNTLLADTVFNSRRNEKGKVVSDIVWNYMDKKITEIICNNNSKNIDTILDWILLPHTKYFALCDKKILMIIPKDTRKKLVMARDNISKDYFNKRELASIEYNRDDFNYIIENIIMRNLNESCIRR